MERSSTITCPKCQCELDTSRLPFRFRAKCGQCGHVFDVDPIPVMTLAPISASAQAESELPSSVESSAPKPSAVTESGSLSPEVRSFTLSSWNESPLPLEFTKPTAIVIRRTRFATTSWKDVLVALGKYLYKWKPDLLRQRCRQVGNRIVLQRVSTGLAAPRSIASNLWIETNFSATRTVRVAIYLAQQCKEDLNAITVEIQSSRDKVEKNEQSELRSWAESLIQSVRDGEKKPREPLANARSMNSNVLQKEKTAEVATTPVESELQTFALSSDVSETDFLKITQPLSLNLGAKRIQVESWKELQVELGEYLYHKAPSVLLELRDLILLRKKGKALFQEYPEGMVEPVKIVARLWLETHFMSVDSLRVFAWVVERCKVNPDRISITCQVSAPFENDATANVTDPEPETTTVPETAETNTDVAEPTAKVPASVDTKVSEPEVQSFTLSSWADSPLTLIFTKPTTVIIYGKRFEVATWRDALVTLCK